MTAVTLYELADEFMELQQKLMTSGIDDQTVSDTIEGLQLPVEEKARAVASVIRSMLETEEAIKAAEVSLDRRRKRVMGRREWLEGYLLENMRRTGITQISHPLMDIKITKNPPAVKIDDLKAVPWEYLRLPPAPSAEPDKAAMRKDMLAGKEIPGAHLEQAEKVEIKI